MEEKNKAKVVELHPNEAKPKKLTYEQLENIAHQLSSQNQQLYNKLQEANIGNMLSRLNFLFKVIENRQAFGVDFVDKCKQEIEDLMTLPEEKEEESEDKE